jgi:hypothetical protein
MCKRTKAIRRMDPLKNALDKEYTKKWSDQNREHLRDLEHKKRQQNQEKKRSKVQNFFAANNDKIWDLLLTIKSKLSIDDVKKHCEHYGIVSLEKIRTYILQKKYWELYNRYLWHQSSLLKYHKGVRSTYETCSENKKQKIRSLYSGIAKEIVGKKFVELITPENVTLYPPSVIKEFLSKKGIVT